jgi:hypothetical protein
VEIKKERKRKGKSSRGNKERKEEKKGKLSRGSVDIRFISDAPAVWPESN